MRFTAWAKQHEKENLMKSVYRVVCASMALYALSLVPAAAQFTQPVDKRTMFTFSAPVSMPGVTLPAGEYVFRLADADSSRKVIHVQHKDGKTYGMFFSIPIDRLEPDSEPRIGFMETASGTPAAVKSWWYPGERSGYEFIYPKDQARKLAQASGEPVLTTKAESSSAEQTDTSDLTRVSAGGNEMAVTSDARPETSAQAEAAPRSATPAPTAVATGGTQQAETARQRLPQTASNAPLILALGVSCLVAGAGFSKWRRVMATARSHQR
jgi:LPXTG-motif cell wall-anchored protein